VILFDGRGILLDVEGTTSSIAFVYDVLFTFARERVGDFLAAHGADVSVRAAALEILAEAGDPWSEGDAPTAFVPRSAAAARELIRRDAKFGPLKSLQGRIWRSGFEDKSLVSHVFDDVPSALELWGGSGLDVRIYSSGSVEAQRLFFGHTAHGDLTGHLRGHYDTAIGPKRETTSYERIAADMALTPRQILFVSDIGEELDAARRAGLQTALADRPGNRPATSVFDHPVVTTFADIVT
jgi:enolase-phosphatase E1